MPKIAIVHEWLTAYAGSERVLEQLLLTYPDAALFAVADFLPAGARGFLHGRMPRTTFLQHAPLARRYLRHYLGLMPLAIEGLDLRGFDIVISSSHAVAKGVLTGPDQFHLCYCHTPLRYAWDLQAQYLETAGGGLSRRGVRRGLARALLHYMRGWDARSANGVDQFVANSHYVARRIGKVYRREAEVIEPPVEVEWFQSGEGVSRSKGDYYLAVARMVPYKRVDLIVSAFARMADRAGEARKLRVIGDGPLEDAVRAKARGFGAAIEFLGEVSKEELRTQLAGAKALVFAAEEDFGITVAESLAAGTPVILYGRGGATEIVEDGVTGVYFDEQTPEAIIEAVLRFERQAARLADAGEMRRAVEGLAPARFRTRFDALLQRCYLEWDLQRRMRPAGVGRMIQSDR